MSTREAPAVPETMAHLPRDRFGRPVPWVASWSSEAWGVSRYDPLVGRQALFTRGRQGRGQPVFGIMDEPRQRKAMVLGLCQVHGRPIEGPRYIADPSPARIDGYEGTDTPVLTEPWACGPCVRWALQHCPGLADLEVVYRVEGGRTAPGLPLPRFDFVAQVVDPTLAPPKRAKHFDPIPPERLEVLRREAERHGGLVGYVRVALRGYEMLRREAVLDA